MLRTSSVVDDVMFSHNAHHASCVFLSGNRTWHAQQPTL